MTDRGPVISQQTLAAFIEALGSTAVAPGCGAAAGVVLALAAGCVAKAFAISARHNPIPELSGAADQARVIAARALEAAERDGRDFKAWLEQPKGAEAGTLEADAQIQFDAAGDLEQLITRHAGAVIESLTADLAAAKAFLQAFRAVEARNLTDLHSER